MEMMKKLLRLCFGNRAFFLTFDLIIGIFIFAITISASLIYISRTYEDQTVFLQQSKLADDITRVLDYRKKFDSLNIETISNNFKEMLPNGYKINFRIKCNNKIIQNLSILPNITISSGERIIVTDNMDFCAMRYWLWQE